MLWSGLPRALVAAATKRMQISHTIWLCIASKMREKRVYTYFKLFILSPSAPLKQDWNITATAVDTTVIKVMWSLLNTNGSLVIGYVISCNSTETRFFNESLQSANNKTTAYCNHLVRNTRYKVQVFAYLKRLPDGQTRIYRSAPVYVRTKLKMGKYKISNYAL